MNKSNVYTACAKAAHAVNKAYCEALGDFSQKEWEQAPTWQTESCIKGVVGVLEHQNSPSDSHASWLKEKEATGWKYGPVKDEEKKEHPCMVHYDHLPFEQKQKDRLFVAAVKDMAAALGWST